MKNLKLSVDLNTLNTFKKVFGKRWLWLVCSALGLLILVLVLLPYGIGYGIRHSLMTAGLDRAGVNDVDFNPFTGKLSIYDLHAIRIEDQVLDIPELTLSFAWRPILSKRAFLEKLVVRDMHITVELPETKRLRIAGLLLNMARKEKVAERQSPWGYGFDRIEVHNSRIQFISPQLSRKLQIGHLSLSRLSTWQKDKAVHIEFKGSLNESFLSYQGDILPFAERPEITGHLKLKALQLKPFSVLAAPHLRHLEGKLDIDCDQKVIRRQDGGYLMDQNGCIAISQMHVKTDRVEFSSESLKWNGVLTEVFGADAAPVISLQGRLNSGAAEACLPGRKLRFQQNRFVWNGNLIFGRQEGHGAVMTGDSSFHEVRISDQQRQLNLLRLKTLELEQIDLRGAHKIDIRRLKAEKVVLAESLLKKREKPVRSVPFLAAFDQAIAENIELTQQAGMTIQAIDLKHLTAQVHRKPDGRWEIMQDLLSARQPAFSDNTDIQPSAVEAGKPRVRIKRLRVGGDSRFCLEDETLAPPYRGTFRIKEFFFRDLDSGRPEQAISFQLLAQACDYSRILLKGFVYPFASKPTLNVEAEIKQLSLPPFSSFVTPALGYHLKSGQLDAELKLDVDRGELCGTNRLVLNNLEVEPEDENKMNQLVQQISMPLPAALSLLRDKENDIHLKIPISGNIKDPKFDLSHTINQALGKAMKLAAIGFLKNSLQPYGTMITIAQIVGKKAFELRLDPVGFAPAGITPLPEALTYLENLAALMNKRPELRITVTGKATESDRTVLASEAAAKVHQALENSFKRESPAKDASTVQPSSLAAPGISDDQLLSLASQRALFIKGHLVKQFAIDSARIFVASPEIDRKNSALPLADLSI